MFVFSFTHNPKYMAEIQLYEASGRIASIFTTWGLPPLHWKLKHNVGVAVLGQNYWPI